MIDLRSDTVTSPTIQMRQAIVNAEVGDDILEEDPTVKILEKRTAEILGKQAALFMPSGTMSNQIAIRSQTEPGDEIIADVSAHCYLLESGACAALSGVTCKLIQGARGIFSADDIIKVLRPKNIHFPPTKIVCLENTHNRGGGSVWPIKTIAEIEQVAKNAGLKMHLDGARIWNASAASGISESEYARHFNSVSVCFSKGLGAPVGSALVGSDELIQKALRIRKQFGGGMRQAGIIAAGAWHALEHHRDRIIQDHENTKELALGIAQLPGIELNIEHVETNIIIFKLSSMTAYELAEKLYKHGVRVLVIGAKAIRLVTHLDISNEQIREAISIFEKVFQTSD